MTNLFPALAGFFFDLGGAGVRDKAEWIALGRCERI
jgi:hypothetical protein